MDRILRGKFLVRKCKTEKGEEVLIIVGVAKPQNFEVSEIKDNDEMWITDIIATGGGIRFSDPVNHSGACSPEEFLEGKNQNVESWKTKGNL